MHFDPENFYYIYKRSFNKALIFYKPANYIYFIKKLHALNGFCEIIAYCLMPGHFHLRVYILKHSEGYTRQTAQSGLTGYEASKK